MHNKNKCLINIFKTEEEVVNHIRSFSGKNNRYINIKPFYIYGFKCIYNYCKTSKGWFSAFEDCCPFCVHQIVEEFGTKEDKILFNKNHDLDEDYNIPLNKKDISEDRKRKRKIKKVSVRDKLTNKELSETLKILKDKKINILRRGKSNLFDDIYRYCFMRDTISFEFEKYVYIKGYKPNNFIEVLSSDEEVANAIAEAKFSVKSVI
jgi:hypothetical protein